MCHGTLTSSLSPPKLSQDSKALWRDFPKSLPPSLLNLCIQSISPMFSLVLHTQSGIVPHPWVAIFLRSTHEVLACPVLTVCVPEKYLRSWYLLCSPKELSSFLSLGSSGGTHTPDWLCWYYAAHLKMLLCVNISGFYSVLFILSPARTGPKKQDKDIFHGNIVVPIK